MMKHQLLAQLKFGMPWFCLGIILAGTLAFRFFQELPRCEISVEKTNLFYTGVDNPISVLVRGVPDELVDLQAEGITLQKLGGGKYSVRATAPGQARIIVSGGDLKPVEFKYRINRFPDPEMCLGKHRFGGDISAGEFKAQQGLSAVVTNMGICGSCETVSYTLTRVSPNTNPIIVENLGARHVPAAQKMIELAKPGDLYIYKDIKVRCPYDAIPRNMESMTFKIK